MYHGLALKHWIKENNLEGYDVRPFQFIVVDSRAGSTLSPIIYQTCDRDIEVGLNGGYLRQDPER